MLDVAHNPDPVYTNDDVWVIASVLPRAEMTNLTLTTWYRAAATNSFTALSMTNSARTYYTTSPIPAQPSQTTVSYYLLATYSREDVVVTQRYPSAWSGDVFSYSVDE